LFRRPDGSRPPDASVAVPAGIRVDDVVGDDVEAVLFGDDVRHRHSVPACRFGRQCRSQPEDRCPLHRSREAVIVGQPHHPRLGGDLRQVPELRRTRYPTARRCSDHRGSRARDASAGRARPVALEPLAAIPRSRRDRVKTTHEAIPIGSAIAPVPTWAAVAVGRRSEP